MEENKALGYGYKPDPLLAKRQSQKRKSSYNATLLKIFILAQNRLHLFENPANQVRWVKQKAEFYREFKNVCMINEPIF